jgi:hypothetical protein
MNKLNKLHSPAFPTFPVQDNLGQLIFSSGLTKLEYMATLIASGMKYKEDILPETVAEYSIEIATAIIEATELEVEKAIEENKEKSKIIKL